jgi:hypothetical protein
MTSTERADPDRARIASERAGAIAVFLAWPAPGGAIGAADLIPSGAVRAVSLRTHALASVIAVLIGCVLAVCSFLLPLAGASSLAWGAGPHLALFCHLHI